MNMLAIIERQQDELAELRKDKARLDFIQRHKIVLKEIMGCWSCYGLGRVRRYSTLGVRNVIDEAMKEAR